MAHSEEDIKRLYITPALEQAGWAKTDIKMEDYYTSGNISFEAGKISRKKGKKCDYCLYQSNRRIAIVEAKSNEYSIAHGLAQAMDYARDLHINFAYSSNGAGFIEHDFITGHERALSLDEFPSPDELVLREQSLLTQKQKNILNTPLFLENKSPRYYQENAINAVCSAYANSQKRILLVMATGTGKTFTAFQIVNKLLKNGANRILYLADRNNLIDQTLKNDFKSLEKYATIVKNRNFDPKYKLYFALYQQATDGTNNYYTAFAPDFFDFIIVDECHRGSAKEDSAWREILEYFSPAFQLGMTATPKNDKEASNLDYFGEPVYTYSLKQGIKDGFLAPYKVVRYILNTDIDGYRPAYGKTDIYGEPVPDELYTTQDLDRKIAIEERTRFVAKCISDFMKNNLEDRYAKTIVFCQDTEHAERMRMELVNQNSDEVVKNDKYIVRITGNDPLGKAELDNFISENERYPVIATTSKLLTTGADTKMVKLIAIDANIGSLAEFKQIIGRGTRINENLGKTYFVILDFRGVSKHFADPDFDGEDESEIITPNTPNPKFPKQKTKEKEPSKKIFINGENVSLEASTEQILDANGKLISSDFIKYSSDNLKAQFQSLNEFLTHWNSQDKKSKILKEFEEQGILIEELRSKPRFAGLDEFDILLFIAYGQTALSRKQRAQKANKVIEKYEGKAREILEILLDKYTHNGINELENPQVFVNEPFTFSNPSQAVDIFGGLELYKQAISELKTQLYA